MPAVSEGERSSGIESRKADHIRICLSEDSQYERTSGFERYELVHEALPEIALDDVRLATELAGRPMAAPLIVSSMTGGTDKGARINRNIAAAAQAAGVAMAVGSQRIAIERPQAAGTFAVRDEAPNIPLFANFGAVQLNYGFGAAEANRAVDTIGADGLFLHLNPLQEAVQPEGNTNFRGLADAIARLTSAVEFPVLVKECGAGIGPRTLERLWALGVAAVDVGGAGGTSWARVESLRASDPLLPPDRSLGRVFADWGIPTAEAIRAGRAAVPAATIIATGGIRDGIDAAKALALGADFVGIAQPVLAAALEGPEAVETVLRRFIAEMRTACFACGASDVADLRAPGRLSAHPLQLTSSPA